MSLAQFLPDYEAPVVERPEVELTPMEKLDIVCDQVATEAFSVGDLSNYLTQKSAQITATLTDAFRFLTTRDYKRPESLNAIALGRYLSTKQYTALQDIEVHVPVGFQGSLLDYVKHLHGAPHAHMTCLIRDVLVPAQKRFGYYLSNPTESNDRRDFQGGSKFSLDDLKALTDAEANFVIMGNHSSRRPLGDVFANLGEVELVAAGINHINKEVWRDAVPGQVEHEVQKLVKISTALFDTLAGGSNASSQFTAALAEELRTVAKWVEWYSVMQTRLGDLTTAMKLNEKELMSV